MTRVELLTVAGADVELISRAQAKQVLTSLDASEEAELDFSGVLQIGRAFADEVVRVWPLAHPETKLKIINVSELVAKMLLHAAGRDDLPQPSRPVEIECRVGQTGAASAST